jgi:hypothetical protein
MDMAMADTVMVDTDGGALPSITRLAGEDGMEVQDLMAFTEIIFMFTTTYMLTTPIMFTETGVVYPARVIIAQVVLRPEQRIIIARHWVRPDQGDLSTRDQMVQDPEPTIIITDPEPTDPQQEGLLPVIIHQVELKEPLYIQTDKGMFISGHSKTATGNRERTDPGRRLITPDLKFKISMHSKWTGAVGNKEHRTFKESPPVNHPEDFIHLVVVAEDAHLPVEAVGAQGPEVVVAAVQEAVVATDRKRILF